jgi:hypothetical protein
VESAEKKFLCRFVSFIRTFFRRIFLKILADNLLQADPVSARALTGTDSTNAGTKFDGAVAAATVIRGPGCWSLRLGAGGLPTQYTASGNNHTQ